MRNTAGKPIKLLLETKLGPKFREFWLWQEADMPKRQRKKQPSTAPGPTPQAFLFQRGMALLYTIKAFQLLLHLPPMQRSPSSNEVNLPTKLLHEHDLQEMSWHVISARKTSLTLNRMVSFRGQTDMAALLVTSHASACQLLCTLAWRKLPEVLRLAIPAEQHGKQMHHSGRSRTHTTDTERRLPFPTADDDEGEVCPVGVKLGFPVPGESNEL